MSRLTVKRLNVDKVHVLIEVSGGSNTIPNVHFSHLADVLVLCGNRTHNPVVASAMLYQRSHTGGQMRPDFTPFLEVINIW